MADQGDEIVSDNLPEDNASMAQVLMVMQALRREVRYQRREIATLTTKTDAQAQEIVALKTEFERARAVTTSVKWIAGIATALLTIYGAIRTYLA